MTYDEAIKMYPKDQVFIQIDDETRLLTSDEYEEFISKQVSAEPLASA